MNHRELTWVLVLAGGAATAGQQSLLDMTLARARRLVPRERILVVVDRAQKRHLDYSLEGLPGDNVIVQPHDRGSAAEILLACLTMLLRDPWARIVALPSHHYVHDEPALASTLLDVATPTAQTRNKVTLVGIQPEEADPELSYILPGRWFEDGTRSVQCLIDSSDKASAFEMVARGALWDSSIVAARATVLVNVMRARMPDLVDQMEMTLAQSDSRDARAGALTQLYARLPFVDFSRVVAEGAAPECRIITARRCGWSASGSVRRLRRYATVADPV
jgi:mannose-1-phosphate guanylyltransferase